MNRIWIRVGSVTYAMKGRDLLQRKGMSVQIERVPARRKGESCGYQLLVPNGNAETVRYLKNAGVEVLGVSGL